MRFRGFSEVGIANPISRALTAAGHEVRLRNMYFPATVFVATITYRYEEGPHQKAIVILNYFVHRTRKRFHPSHGTLVLVKEALCECLRVINHSTAVRKVPSANSVAGQCVQ